MKVTIELEGRFYNVPEGPRRTQVEAARKTNGFATLEDARKGLRRTKPKK